MRFSNLYSFCTMCITYLVLIDYFRNEFTKEKLTFLHYTLFSLGNTIRNYLPM